MDNLERKIHQTIGTANWRCAQYAIKKLVPYEVVWSAVWVEFNKWWNDDSRDILVKMDNWPRKLAKIIERNRI